MKKLFFVVSLACCCNALAQDLSLYRKDLYIDSKGDTLPYRILFPENYDKTKKYPLVLFLHGSGERGKDNESQLKHGANLFITPTARTKFPCIVVFPQCPDDSFWGSEKTDENKTPEVHDFDYSRPPTRALVSTIALIKKITKKESVDRSRVYITGLSRGGMGTFEAVYRYPRLFAAALPICGGGDVQRYDLRVKKIPFWIFHGDADITVEVKYSRNMVEKLKSINGRVKYSEYPGVSHNSWDNALAEPDYLSWMFSKRR